MMPCICGLPKRPAPPRHPATSHHPSHTMTADSKGTTLLAGRVGIVGTGHRARLYNSAVTTRGSHIVALCDTNPERRAVHNRMLEEAGCARAKEYDAVSDPQGGAGGCVACCCKQALTPGRLRPHARRDGPRRPDRHHDRLYTRRIHRPRAPQGHPRPYREAHDHGREQVPPHPGRGGRDGREGAG